MTNLSISRRLLSGSNHYEVNMDSGNMRATIARGSTWNKSEFKFCHFDSSDFSGATFSFVTFFRCNFQNSVFSGARFSDCTFTECDMLSTNFSSARIVETGFDSCKLEYSAFLDANLSAVAFEKCNLSSAHLLYATAKDVDYTGSNLHNCSIKLGCPFFRDARFDERQWSYMQSLISKVEGIQRLHDAVIPHIDPRVMAAVTRMMDDEADEEFE